LKNKLKEVASIFEQETVSEFKQRIEKLTPVTQHLWGTMTVSQMLAHIQQPIMVALGDTKPKQNMFAKLLGGVLRRKYVNREPFTKNLPTASSFVVSDERNFEHEKQDAIQYIERLSALDRSTISGRKHPIFGNLSAEEWDMLLVKHLEHHLRQFGV